jgi:DNA-binding transcriptional ArsR family regulator
VAGGRALNDILLESLSEIENELQNQPRLTKLKAFVALTREGKGVTEASRAIGVTPEYASRHLKRLTVELLGEKLKQKLH